MVNSSIGEKKDFWQDLHELIEIVSKQESLVLGADLNGHVGKGSTGDEEIMGWYGAGTRNKEGSMVVDFAKSCQFGACQHLFHKEEQTQGDE